MPTANVGRHTETAVVRPSVRDLDAGDHSGAWAPSMSLTPSTADCVEALL